MIIRKASQSDITTIHKLAHEIWIPTYIPILSPEQIDLMLGKIYSEDALEHQMNNGHIFLLAEREEKPVAFADYSLEYSIENIYKLHKIYILPLEQGRGTGKVLIEYVKNLCRTQLAKTLELNVNRNNPALGFYTKIGFTIFKEVDIPYYQFVLNDFVLRTDL